MIDDMENVLLMSMAMKVLWAALGLVALRFILKWFDRMSGLDFKEWGQTNGTKDIMAFYYGLRFLAIGIVISAAIS